MSKPFNGTAVTSWLKSQREILAAATKGREFWIVERNIEGTLMLLTSSCKPRPPYNQTMVHVREVDPQRDTEHERALKLIEHYREALLRCDVALKSIRSIQSKVEPEHITTIAGDALNYFPNEVEK